jgi:CheY-like chemotaxis protein
VRNVVRLHGSVGAKRVVLASSDYARRLYLDPGYVPFLRAMMATSTFVYLGFSFTDHYLNEVRRELLTLFAHAPDEERPMAYAIMPGEPNDLRLDHMERHEGLRVIRYSSTSAMDHVGFDALLQQLSARTNATARLRASLDGRRILWIDPTPDNNAVGLSVLGRMEGSRGASGGAEIVTATSLVEAQQLLASRDAFDLIITHWGHRPGSAATAEQLLALPRQVLKAPVIVFCAPGRYAADNRKRALRLGAYELATQWWELFAAVDRCVSDAHRW